MNRRRFFELLGIGGGAALVPKKYFDIGSAWQKRESGLVVPPPVEVFADFSQPIAFSAMGGPPYDYRSEEYIMGRNGPEMLYVRRIK